jgi:hypothetical protein
MLLLPSGIAFAARFKDGYLYATLGELQRK